MSLRTDALTANEAASVARVPLKQVNRIIDAGLLAGKVNTHAGARMVSQSALVGLRLAHLTADIFTLQARRRIVSRVLTEPAASDVREEAVTVTITPIAAEIDEGLHRLERARAMVTGDPDTIGGAPCFVGTRIPVHDIADLIANGDTLDGVAGAYPQLTPDQIGLASVYATAYPRRGRPPKAPAWRKSAPRSSKVIPFGDLPTVA
jgi:uncharacterized protein (DUF433 family)